jgi:type II secretory pathway component GspD/PulD (secretin)
MGESTLRNNTNLRPATLAVTAAALFCLAGTPGAFAQSAKSKTGASAAQPAATQPATTPPVTQPPASGAPKSAGNGKVMHQAGTAPTAAGADSHPVTANPVNKDGADAGDGSDKVKVDEHLIVDLHVNDEDLANVLQMLSIQSQKNIVTSKSVSAVVTANLYGVTFYEALDAILHVNGYGYIERGNFIYVYTLDEIQKIEAELRTRVWKVVKLNYLNSTDAAEFVKPLLSEGGQIKTNGKAPNFQLSENAPSGAEDYAHDSTMMVFDYEENLGEIEKVIKELDTRPAQVLVEATILQTSLNEQNAFGVDFSIIGDMNFTDFVNIGGPLEAVNGLIKGSGSASGGGSGSGSGGSGSGGSGSGSGGSGSGSGSGSTGTPLPADNKGAGLVSSPGNTAGPATLKLGIVWNDVAAFIRMLDQVADTTIISRPNILTLNRQPARVLVGRKVGYLNSTTTDTATTQTVEFLDTGTQLYFRPFVSSDGSIRMELKPKVSEAVIRNANSTNGQVVTIPDEISNELTTNVIVKDGQTIVLGGLFRESTTANRSQVPGLGDIPVIGAAFRGHDDSTDRQEIIFMITPTIIADAVLKDQGERGKAMVERARAGAREGTLLWSREKRCQQMIMEATQLARDGQREKALSKVQRALTLDPMQQDAILLREQLMNQKDVWPTRSMQHEIVTGELEKKLSGGAKKSELNLPPTPAPRAASRPAPKPPEVAVEGAGQVVFTEEPKLPDPEPTDPAAQPEPVMPDPSAEPAKPDPNMPEPKSEPTNPEPDPMSPEPAADPNNPAPSEPGMEPGTEPSPEPATDPGTEPSPEPGTDPGTEPSPEPSPEPGTNPGTEPSPAPAPKDPGTPKGLSAGHTVNYGVTTVATKNTAVYSPIFAYLNMWRAQQQRTTPTGTRFTAVDTK